MLTNKQKVCLEPGFTGIYNRTDELGDFLPTLYSRESHTISVVRTLAFGFRQNRRALHTLPQRRESFLFHGDVRGGLFTILKALRM